MRRGLLVAHIVCSVGWLGGVVTSLALAVDGATAALSFIGWAILLPASLGSLASGVATALASRWGLVRHWWVLIKLVMNVLATGVLLLYLATLTDLTPHDPAPVVHAAAAVVLLVVATVLSVYKPRGRTRAGAARGVQLPYRLRGGLLAAAQRDHRSRPVRERVRRAAGGRHGAERDHP
jgi:hypothetical protein